MKKIIGIIDNNIKDLEDLKSNLSNANMGFFEINTNQDIVGQLQAYPPHLIITEMSIDQVDLLELIIQYKKNDVYKNIPVMVYTSEMNTQLLSGLDEKYFSKVLPKNRRWGAILNEINTIFRKSENQLLIKKMDTLMMEAKGRVFEMGAVIGLGETSFMFASDLSFRPNIILNVNNPILDAIKYDACVLKTIRSQPLLNSRYKYKTKCSLPGLSEENLQNLRKWMYQNCQRRV